MNEKAKLIRSRSVEQWLVNLLVRTEASFSLAEFSNFTEHIPLAFSFVSVFPIQPD
jgi:hypothetical protein